VKARATLATSLAAAGLLLLSGCATAITGTARAATSLPVAEATVQEEPIDASETVDASTPEESVETEDSATPIPPTAPSTEPTDSGYSSEDGGGAIDPDSVTWISAFCYGFSDVMQYTDPDVSGMSDDAVLQTVVDAYDGMAQAAMETAYLLDSIAQPTFPGADSVGPALQNWLLAVADVYGAGAETMASTTFHSADEFQATIDQIESGMIDPNDELGLAMADIDPAVKATITGLPECAPLIGG
jgi:hypothetical protein